MLTTRGWWWLFHASWATGLGLLLRLEGISFLGFMGLAWLLASWVRLRLGCAGFPAVVSMTREVADRGGAVRMLRAGRRVVVKVRLRHRGRIGWPLVRLEDRVPDDGAWNGPPGWWPGVEGALPAGGELAAQWPLDFPLPGVARFEGLRLTVADSLGLVASVMFLRDGAEYPVLPAGATGDGDGTGVKRANLMPPPGGHRHRKPGGSAEILDIRDYRIGDSPRWIAWKQSARRDRVLVKEFENEVPVRCQVIIDATTPVRRWQPGGSAFCRLSMAAAEILEACDELRDPVGMIITSEIEASVERPNRGGRHSLRMLQRLARESSVPADQPPVDEDPWPLFEPAAKLAMEIYPELYGSPDLLPGWNRLMIGPGRPGFSRHGGWTGWIFRNRGYVWLAPPAILVAAYAMASPWLCMAATWSGPILWALARTVTAHHTLRFRERKRLASVLAARQGGDPALVDALLEDDTLLATRLRSFLAEHRRDRFLPVPPPPPLTTFSRARAERIARAVRAAAARARDPECHFLLTDSSGLPARLEVLVSAARLVRARRHQLVVILDEGPERAGVSQLVEAMARLRVPVILTRTGLAKGEVARLITSVRRMSGRTP